MSDQHERTCFPLPEKYWTTHYGAVDPATTHEPNPECRARFTPEEIEWHLRAPVSIPWDQPGADPLVDLEHALDRPW